MREVTDIARDDQSDRRGVDGAPSADPRLAAYEAALTIARELHIDAVLQRIVDLSRDVVPARYAALGVADETGRLRRFLTSGISEAERAAIGPLPEGHGLLGVLIHDGLPLLVPEISADVRSAGFPANHPPMHNLLGVPITFGEVTLGNLYLTNRLDGGPFLPEDLAAVEVLAAHAATAIDRARLYQQGESARRLAEEQRDQLRVILDSLPAGVLIQAPPDGAIELANAAAIDLLLGSAPSGAFPLYGRDYQLLQDDGPPLARHLQPGIRALHGEQLRHRQFMLHRWDDTRVSVLLQAAPLRNSQGDINRAVVVFQDVTQLREAEQLKDDFLSLISHEIRTPLTAIHGGARLLADHGEALDEKTRRDLLHDVVVESERLNQMLGNMLSLTAIQAGRIEAKSEPVLIHALVRQVMRDIEGRAPRHTFAIDIPPDLPPADGDPELLAQVLRNLYENAVKYAPAGGQIVTSAAADASRVTISVTDQGVGIAPEHVTEVFERFRRPGAEPTVRGMGLGLYLSRHLVQAQGGTIAAESPGPGRGATFAVTLPIADGSMWPDTEGT